MKGAMEERACVRACVGAHACVGVQCSDDGGNAVLPEDRMAAAVRKWSHSVMAAKEGRSVGKGTLRCV